MIVFNSLSIGSDTNLSHPDFHVSLVGPVGEYRDVVGNIIVKQHNI